MTIYVAGPYARRDECIAVMHHLESLGHLVTSRWLREPTENSDAAARMDLDDVAAAGIFLLLNLEKSGGKDVEMGYALALNKQIVLVGARTNVFHYLDCVRVIERVEEL